MLRLLLLALFAALAAPAGAQEGGTRLTLVLRGVPVDDALDRLVEATGMDLIYGSEVVGGRRVFCALEAAPAEEHLRCIVREAGLDFYRLSSGTYVVTEAAQEVPLRGALAGVVVDAQTGEPLPFANVLLADASAGTAASAAGLFSVANLVAGPYRVVTSYVGYEPVVDSVYVPAGGTVRRRVALQPVVLASPGTVVVNGLQARLPSDLLGATELAPEGFAEPGLPGPSSATREASGRLGLGSRWPPADLHIQGGQAAEHRTFIDGIPVYEPVAFGRLFSAFSPLAVSQVTVRKAGFGAPYGSSTAGAVEARHGLSDGPPSVVVESDPYSANGRLQSGLRIGGADGAVLLAGRTGLWDLYRPPPLDGAIRDWNRVDPLLEAVWLAEPVETASFTPHRHGSDVGFTDLHAAARLRLGAFRTLSASAYYGHNRVATELFAAGTPDAAAPEALPLLLSRDAYRWTNTGAQVRHDWLLGARTVATARVHAARLRFTHTYGHAELDVAAPVTPAEGEALLGARLDAEQAGLDLNALTELAAEGVLAYSFSARHSAEVGVEVTRIGTHFHLGGQDAPVGRGFRLLDRQEAPWLLAGYVEDRRALGLRTLAEVGARVTYVPDRRTAYVEPRLAIRHDVPASPLGAVAVRAAAGLYRQFVNGFDLSTIGPSALVPVVRFWLPVDAAIAPPLAYHLAGDVLVEPSEGLTFRGEVYLKPQPRLLEPDYGVLLGSGDHPAAPFISQSSGLAYGGGLEVERRTGRAAARLAYAFAHAERHYPGRFDGRRVVTPWTEPHRLSAALDLRLGGGLTALARGRGVWGRAWAFRQAYYDYLPAHTTDLYGGFHLDAPEDDAAGAFLTLDLGLRYERPVAGARLTVAAEVANVFDRANVLDWSLQPVATDGEVTYERVTRVLPGVAPSVRMAVAF